MVVALGYADRAVLMSVASSNIHDSKQSLEASRSESSPVPTLCLRCIQSTTMAWLAWPAQSIFWSCVDAVFLNPGSPAQHTSPAGPWLSGATANPLLYLHHTKLQTLVWASQDCQAPCSSSKASAASAYAQHDVFSLTGYACDKPITRLTSWPDLWPRWIGAAELCKRAAEAPQELMPRDTATGNLVVPEVCNVVQDTNVHPH